MKKVVFIALLIYGGYFFLFAQINDPNWKNLIPNYSFEEHDFSNGINDKRNDDENKNHEKINPIHLVKNDDSLIEENTHGVYLELLGRNGVYSIGYEYTYKIKKNSFGVAVGSAVYRHSSPSKDFLNYNLNLTPFYEYGGNVGIRSGMNLSFGINPIMFTNKLDDLYDADKPPVYTIMPSNSLGLFFNTKNRKYHYLINGYLLYRISIYDNRKTAEILPWLGLTFKYNFKTDVK